MTVASEEAISFVATTTLDDVAAVDTHMQAGAVKKRSKRAWRGPLIFLVSGFVGLGAVVASSDDPIKAVSVFLTTSFALQMILVMVMLYVLALLPVRALRRFNRRATRKIYADTRTRHPAVDARDPALRMARLYRFDETGMTTTTDFDEIWEAWPRITGLDETPDLLIVRVGGTTGYPLPKAQLTEALQERLLRYIAGRSHSKWPF